MPKPANAATAAIAQALTASSDATSTMTPAAPAPAPLAASAPTPSPTRASVSAAPTASVGATAAPDAGSSGAAAAPVVSPGQAAEILAPIAPPTAAQIRTLEDTVAELLRPMLRQWLDANMPRIVEKALRVEVAESIKSSGRTTKS